ncbi:hypothetical protein CcBV_3.3 [Bracoviriform congregatae]|uniref:BEN domain-containing protein n=1 Tax=Bracoviriform congregatae TaxID=39640 RepID=Q5ZP56_9VIRU|nr:hypothetical protein CcBV_3.3 [Bracoviriform congregatae]CAG17397.1 hypothetical protein CcBV_3.3 [Bracoviriform congregatae]
MRIMNGDEPSKEWKLYMAIIKLESHSYENACEFIMEKIHNASKKKCSDVMRIGEYLYCWELCEFTLMIIIANDIVDKPKLRNMISNSRKFSEYFNVKSRTLTSLELQGFVSPEKVVMKKPYVIEHEDQASGDVRSSSDDLFFRYPYLEQISEKDNGTQVNSPGASSRSTGKTFFASEDPLTFVNQICDYSQKPEENQLLSIYPNQFSQLEISESSPVIQEHPQFLPKQKTPDRSSEVKYATSEPTTHSKMTSASHASIACTNSAEHQDSIVEDMVVDDLTEASCIEQNVFSGTRAENESSANPKALEVANHSGQTIESSMEKGSPIVEAVTSSGILSTQDVGSNEQSISSDLNSDAIITTSPNSNEQAKQSVISELNQADVWLDQVFDIFQKMKINFSETCQIAYELHESLLESQKVIDCMANVSENLRALKKGKFAVVTSKEVTAEVQQIAEENQGKRKDEENPDVSMEEDEEEDNDVNSKSSENYDDCGGDKDVKAHCKLAAKESKELARMLLVEIFSQSALNVCSLTSVRANAFDISGTNVRPGLDEKARITILSFVKEHALEKNWSPFDSQSVINSLRSKIQDEATILVTLCLYIMCKIDLLIYRTLYITMTAYEDHPFAKVFSDHRSPLRIVFSSKKQENCFSALRPESGNFLAAALNKVATFRLRRAEK